MQFCIAFICDTFRDVEYMCFVYIHPILVFMVPILLLGNTACWYTVKLILLAQCCKKLSYACTSIVIIIIIFLSFNAT